MVTGAAAAVASGAVIGVAAAVASGVAAVAQDSRRAHLSELLKSLRFPTPARERSSRCARARTSHFWRV